MSFNSLPKLLVNLDNVVHNYNYFRNLLACRKAAAVVKADAYGVGMGDVAKSLADKASCQNFFVASITEGILLRQLLGESCNIYTLSGILHGEAKEFIEYQLIPVINSWHQLEIWKETSRKYNQELKMLIHFDTGMNRLGFNVEDAQKLANYDFKGLQLLYVMSHLASADDQNSLQNKEQLDKFITATNYFPNIQRSFTNSAGSFLDTGYHFDMGRVGKGLYGPNKTVGVIADDLKRAVVLKAPILQVRTINESGTVGYNATYKIKPGTKLAILALGYADGYMRSFSNRARVYYKGYMLPLVGRVSMDYITIDISDVPEQLINIGDLVEIFGENISYEKQFFYSSTSTYELFSRLSGRIHKQYHIE